MTPYERGYAAALKAAVAMCEKVASRHLAMSDYQAATALECKAEILSLPIVGEATNPGEQAESPSVSDGQVETPRASSLPPARPGPSQECVMVPRADLQSIIDSYEMGPEIYPTTEHCLEATIDKLRAMLTAKEEHDAQR